MNKFLASCIVIVAALSPLRAWADDLEAFRKEAEAHVVPHASIPARELITDDVFKRIPADSEYFRKFLQRVADALSVSVIFPPVDHVNRSGYVQPMIEAVGISELTLSDGHRADINVVYKWSALTNRYLPKLVAKVEFFVTVGYDMADGTGALILPCTAEVSEDKQVYSYSKASVDLKKTIIVTRPKQ